MENTDIPCDGTIAADSGDKENAPFTGLVAPSYSGSLEMNRVRDVVEQMAAQWNVGPGRKTGAPMKKAVKRHTGRLAIGCCESQGIPVLARWRRWFVWGLVGCGWLWAAPVLAAPADEASPIGSITINPMANNRRAVILLGKVKDAVTYQGEDGLGRSLCGQAFILEDETGSLDVLYLVRCQANEPPVLAGEGEQVIVYATIDVSPDNIKNKEGKELVFKAMATKIIRRK
jgi:hypothetical protein